MTTETLPLDPVSYELDEIDNDRGFQSQSSALQIEGRTGNRWGLHASFMTDTAARRRSFDGMLAAVKGRRNRIKFILPGYTPAGSAGGTPLLNGANSAGATSISVKGLALSTSGIWLAGDYVTIGNQLVQLAGDLDSDGSGNGSVGIWPELHQNYSDGDSIEVAAPYGIFFQASPAKRPENDDPHASTRSLMLEEDVLA